MKYMLMRKADADTENGVMPTDDLLQAMGLAPFVNRFSRQSLVTMLAKAGFSIDYEWQPGKSSVFLVARK